MSRHNYQVQLQCQPLAASDAEGIARSLSQSFPVTGFRRNEAAVLIDLESRFPLAYGALKDLADLVIDRATEMNLRLLSAVIHQVDVRGPARAVSLFCGWVRISRSWFEMLTTNGAGGLLPELVEG